MNIIFLCVCVYVCVGMYGAAILQSADVDMHMNCGHENNFVVCMLVFLFLFCVCEQLFRILAF